MLWFVFQSPSVNVQLPWSVMKCWPLMIHVSPVSARYLNALLFCKVLYIDMEWWCLCVFRIWRGRVFIGAALLSAALQMISTHPLIPAALSVTVQILSIRNNATLLLPVYVCSLICVCLSVCIRGQPNPCAKWPEMDRQGERVYHLHLQCEETKMELSGNHFRRNKKTTTQF